MKAADDGCACGGEFAPQVKGAQDGCTGTFDRAKETDFVLLQ
jgi:hypothetical protein